MDTGFSALASRIAASSDVLGCMILSSDGDVLGAFPLGDEHGLKPAWLKFTALGDTKRGFVRFSDDQLWAYVRSGPYAAFAVAMGGTRPGVLLDQLEQALLLATESREMREAARPPARVSLVEEQQQLEGVAARAASGPTFVSTVATTSAPHMTGPTMDAPPPPAREVMPGAESGPPAERPEQPKLDGEEVDRVALAREFSFLLQDGSRGVEIGE
jgi:hypothetical protein